MSTDGGTNQAPRREVLKGLPAEGPFPTHFHQGHPTPWTEGFVVRFRNAGGNEWVGNFQEETLGRNEVVHWPEANALIVIAADNFYLIHSTNPGSYVSGGPLCFASGLFLNDDRTTLFVADLYKVVAYRRDRKPIWQATTEDLGMIIWMGERDGIVAVEVEVEMGEALVDVRISPHNGSRPG